MAWYSVVLVALASVLAFLVFTRSDVEATLLRAPGALFQQTSSGEIENLYTLKVVNKTSHDIPLELKLENVKGTLKLMGGALIVPKEQLAQTPVLIALAPEKLTAGRAKLSIGIYADGKRVETVETVFIGPRTNGGN
jgi:hypothetical protein